MSNVFAYTSSGYIYPEYLSVNECPDGCKISVRGPSVPFKDHEEGAHATMSLPLAQVDNLIEALRAYRRNKRKRR